MSEPARKATAGPMARRTAERVKRQPVPALAAQPVGERLDGPPAAGSCGRETAADQARRELIGQPGQWRVLNPKVKLSEATARRLARSFQRSNPARLDGAAAGRFDARAFQRDGAWHVAAAYEPTRAGT